MDARGIRVALLEVASEPTQHYYGKVYHHRLAIPVERSLSEAAAARLNRGDGFIWRRGSRTERFDTIRHLLAAGSCHFYEQLVDDGARVLLLGERGDIDPIPVLAWADEVERIAKEMQIVHDQTLKIGKWANPRRMHDLTKLWDSLIEQLDGEAVSGNSQNKYL